MMGITWKECLPSPSLGLQAALGPLIPGDGWTVSRLARQLHWVHTCTGSGWLCRSTSHWSRRPALLGLTIPTVECHLPLVWAHLGLIRPTVFGPKLKQRTFTGPRILCSYPPSPNCLVMRTACRLYMVFYINQYIYLYFSQLINQIYSKIQTSLNPEFVFVLWASRIQQMSVPMKRSSIQF